MIAQPLSLRLTADITSLQQQMQLAREAVSGAAAGMTQGARQAAQEMMGVAAAASGMRAQVGAAYGQMAAAAQAGASGAKAALDAIAEPRTVRRLEAEIARVAAAYQELERSGGASGAALGRAAIVHHAAIARLRAEMQALAETEAAANRRQPAARLDAAREVLSLRSNRELEREIARVDAAYTRLASSGKVSAEELVRAQSAHQAAVARLRGELGGMGSSAAAATGQVGHAMRMLPAQASDVATQLAGGQNPLLILLQQGLQTRDMFGGFRPMFAGIAAAITPAVLGIGALVGTLAGLAAAYVSGQNQDAEMRRSLQLTGNAAGLTASSFDALIGRTKQAAGVSAGAAREAAVVAVQMGLSGRALDAVAGSMAAYSRAAGTTAEESKDLFQGIGKDALGWAQKVSQSTNFLTLSTWAQIKALQEQGKGMDAAAVAAKALQASLENQQRPLGTIETVLKAGRDAWSDWWAAASGLGREKTTAQAIADLEARIAVFKGKSGLLVEDAISNFRNRFGAGPGPELKDAEDELKRKRAVQQFDELRARQEAAAAAANKAQVAAAGYIDTLRRQNSPMEDRRRQVAEYTRHVQALEGTQSAISAAQQKRDLQDIYRRTEDRQSMAASDAALQLSLTKAKAAAEARVQFEDAAQQELQAARDQGLLQEREYAAASLATTLRKLDAEQALIQRQVELERARRLSAGDAAAGLQQKARLEELAGRAAAVDAQRALAVSAQRNTVKALDLEQRRADAQAFVQVWVSARDQAQALAEAVAVEQAQLITNPIERAAALAALSVESMRRQAGGIVEAWDAALSQLQRAAAQAMKDGNTELQASLEAQAAMLQAQRDKFSGAAQRQQGLASKDPAREYIENDPTAGLSAGWEGVTTAIGGAVRAMQTMLDSQVSYNAAVKAAAGDQQLLAAIEARRGQITASTYSSTLAAMKGVFKEGSAGYKALERAERAYRATELALAIKSALQKMGLLQAFTTAKVVADRASAASAVEAAAVEVAASQASGQAAAVAGTANQAGGDPYTAFARMAAMAAAMAALGFVVSGGFNRSSGGAPDPGNTGTGTVLGDAAAQSKSISRSIDMLREVDTLTMRYSAEMLASLQNIEAAMSGVASLLVRAGDANTGAGFGVQTGLLGRNQGNPLINASGMPALKAMDKALLQIPVLGDLLGKVYSWWGKTTQDIEAAGLLIQGQMDQILSGQGINQFADVKTTESSWFGLKKDTTRQTISQPATDETTRQFALIFQSVQDALVAAAGPLGLSAQSVAAAISNIPVAIGKVDLKGLTGEQIQAKLEAVIGAASDAIAKTAFEGLDAFQRIGEGYFETVLRVATGTEQARVTLDRLGLVTPAISAVGNKTADVAAELVRLAIVARESGNSIGQMVSGMQGAATDIADAYMRLDRVRSGLQSIGISGQSVTSALLAGAGGLDELAAGMADFEENILTETERRAVKAARLEKQFSALGLAVPSSAAAFKALVLGIDTSTEAGQRLLGAVLNLSSGFADMQTAVTDLGKGIEDEINRIRGLLTGAAGTTVAQYQAQFALATAQARAGDKSALDALPGLSKALTDAAEKQATNRFDLVLQQAAVMRSLQETLAIVRQASAASVPHPADPVSPPIEPQIDPGGIKKLFPSVRQYADGGDFGGGLRIVGEEGPELEATGPSRIFNASETAGILAGGGRASDALLHEMQALRNEVVMLRAEVSGLHADANASAAAIAGHAGKTARILERVTPDGDALATRAQA